jgi:arsenate reductase-like glutaredoxin family protein
LLLAKQVAFEERDFFKERFTRAELEGLLAGRPASEAFSFRSPSFKKLGQDPTSLSSEDLLELMLQEPRLILRPVLKIGSQAHFGAVPKIIEGLLANE